MNKIELTKKVSTITGKTFNVSKLVSEATLEAIKQGLEQEGEVRLSGFGTFKMQARSARVGRNPKTGEAVNIPEKQVVKFKPYF